MTSHGDCVRHKYARDGGAGNREDYSRGRLERFPAIIALGDGSQRALMEAFQAGCDDYIDRQLSPATIANHVKNIIVSKLEGFQPTQMLGQADTSLSGNLTHHDLTGVMQMLGHARQTAR